MNRFDRSCIRSFFTLPSHLINYPNSHLITERSKKYNPLLLNKSFIEKDNIKYYIFWLDDPESMKENDLIDLSFRDFSFYQLPPCVLIRKANK